MDRLPDSVYWRRRAVALGVLALPVAGAMLATRGDTDAPVPSATPTPAPKRAELPGGGRTIFPDRRVVAFYGAPQADELGALGIGTPTRAGIRLLEQAKPYERKTRPVLPAMELIAVIAAAHPGDDGAYRTRQDAKTIDRYLRAARKIGALLVLDIQPGRSDFLTEAKQFERWLREPDVGLALDPEWRVVEGQVPGQVIGRVEASEVNAVSAWLQGISEEEHLPQKLFVIHEFTDDMVAEDQIEERPGLAIVFNVDGFGGREIKLAKYNGFVSQMPRFAHQGYKLFYREDTNLMKPRNVMRMRPPPDLVVYE